MSCWIVSDEPLGVKPRATKCQCLPARESKVADGLRFVGQATGQIEMSSELGRMLVQAVRVRRLDRLGDAQVQPLTPRQRERPQKRLGISSCVKL